MFKSIACMLDDDDDDVNSLLVVYAILSSRSCLYYLESQNSLACY